MNQQTKDIDKEWCLLVQKHATVLVHKHSDWGQLCAKHNDLMRDNGSFYYGFYIAGGGFAKWDGDNFFCSECGKQAPDSIKYVALLAFVKKLKIHNSTYVYADNETIPIIHPDEKDRTIIKYY